MGAGPAKRGVWAGGAGPAKRGVWAGFFAFLRGPEVNRGLASGFGFLPGPEVDKGLTSRFGLLPGPEVDKGLTSGFGGYADRRCLHRSAGGCSGPPPPCSSGRPSNSCLRRGALPGPLSAHALLHEAGVRQAGRMTGLAQPDDLSGIKPLMKRFQG